MCAYVGLWEKSDSELTQVFHLAAQQKYVSAKDKTKLTPLLGS